LLSASHGKRLVKNTELDIYYQTNKKNQEQKVQPQKPDLSPPRTSPPKADGTGRGAFNLFQANCLHRTGINGHFDIFHAVAFGIKNRGFTVVCHFKNIGAERRTHAAANAFFFVYFWNHRIKLISSKLASYAP